MHKHTHKPTRTHTDTQTHRQIHTHRDTHKHSGGFHGPFASVRQTPSGVCHHIVTLFWPVLFFLTLKYNSKEMSYTSMFYFDICHESMRNCCG